MRTEPSRGTAPNETAGVIMLPPLLFGIPLVLGYIVQRWIVPVTLPDALQPIGLVLVIASLIPGPWALVLMLMRGVNPEPHVPTSSLVIEGPFRFTRNPIYLTYVLFIAGLGLLLANGWILLLLIPALIVAHYGIILREERYLSRRFGAPYDEYRQRVRRWL